MNSMGRFLKLIEHILYFISSVTVAYKISLNFKCILLIVILLYVYLDIDVYFLLQGVQVYSAQFIEKEEQKNTKIIQFKKLNTTHI